MASLETRNHATRTTYRVVWFEDGKKQPAVTFIDLDEAVRFRKLVEGQPGGDAYPREWTPRQTAAPRPKPTQLTFGDWAETAIGRRTRASERTKNDYRRDLRLHFTELHDIELAKLDTDDVIAWLETKAGAVDEHGKPLYAGKTIRNLYGFAASVFNDAMAQRPPLADHNPFGARLPDLAAVRTEEMVFLTPQEFGLLAGHVRDEYQTLIRLLAGTGLRFGEATALTVGDIDLLARRKTLTVTKAWKRTGTNSWTVGEPKTKRSRRTISLSGELVNLLTPVWAGRRGDELLFPGADGGRLPHIEVYKRGWSPAVANARVCDMHRTQANGRGKQKLLPDPCDCVGVLTKQPRIHDLRHSHASWLITEGLPLPAISRRLGHSSINITIDRYGHLDPSLDDAVNAAVDRAMARR